MEAAAQVIARGDCDTRDWLLKAEEPLAALQLACGGELPGLLAIPDILALVREARISRHRAARLIRAQDERHAISAWVEAAPSDEGCQLAVSGWQAKPLPQESDGASIAPAEVGAVAADAYLRLDAGQRVLACVVHDPALQALSDAVRTACNCPWTDLVAVQGYDNAGSLHWRLLDRAIVTPLDCDGRWRALLTPQFGAARALVGFDLHLVRVPDESAPKGETDDGLSEVAFEDAARILRHDLVVAVRGPIERITMRAEALAREAAGPLPEPYTGYPDDIAEAARYLRGLIDDLGARAGLAYGVGSPVAEVVDLADAARRAAAMLRRMAEERGMTVDRTRVASPLLAAGDPRHVMQILLNLLANALRYAPEGTMVRIVGQVENHRVRLTVIDEGAGFEDSQRERLFDSFERHGRKRDGGMGLGLAIARKLARAMGGDVVAEAEGAMAFTLELPAA